MISGTIYQFKDNRIAVKTDHDKWKRGESILIHKGEVRSLDSNAYYWAMLEWILRPGGGDLQSQGCLSPYELHDDLKRSIGIETTTYMNNAQFSSYIEKCKYIVNTFHNIDLTIFEELHDEHNANGHSRNTPHPHD